MSARQAARHDEILHLSTKLDAAKGPEALRLLNRLDCIVAEAASVDRVETPEGAVASLEIALHAMGADLSHPRPEERLIKLAAAFLKTLLWCVVAGEQILAPFIGGCGAIISNMTGLA